MARIQLTTTISAPPDLCFDLVLNVDVQLQLDRSMRAVGGIRSGRLHRGDIVTWGAVHFGVPWRMTSEIIVVERPRRFVDEMQRGPFASWRHVHEFEPTEEGTLMNDSVAYEAPLGPIGGLFNSMVLQQYLTRLLARRNRRLKQLAEGIAHPS